MGKYNQNHQKFNKCSSPYASPHPARAQCSCAPVITRVPSSIWNRWRGELLWAPVDRRSTWLILARCQIHVQSIKALVSSPLFDHYTPCSPPTDRSHENQRSLVTLPKVISKSLCWPRSGSVGGHHSCAICVNWTRFVPIWEQWMFVLFARLMLS